MSPESKNSAVATGAASGGVVGAVTTIIVWTLSLLHVTVPAEIATSMMVLLTPIVHLFAVKYGLSNVPNPGPGEVMVKATDLAVAADPKAVPVKVAGPGVAVLGPDSFVLPKTVIPTTLGTPPYAAPHPAMIGQNS